jgi:hypothetical protein
MFGELPTEFYATKMQEEWLKVTMPRAGERAIIERELAALRSDARRERRTRRGDTIAGRLAAWRRSLLRGARPAALARHAGSDLRDARSSGRLRSMPKRSVRVTGAWAVQRVPIDEAGSMPEGDSDVRRGRSIRK